MKEYIKEAYELMGRTARARELLVALLPNADIDAALIDPTVGDLLTELTGIAEAANTGVGEQRRESLRLAIEAGTPRETLVKIAEAVRLKRGETITLPAGRYEHLSRGKGWARKGRGDSAEWGERADGGGYSVGPGKWTVGSSDGFKRKSSTDWKVEHVAVGAATWTIAN